MLARKPLQPLHASSNSIEKAWSVMLAESLLDVDISNISTILEFGGSGNGQVGFVWSHMSNIYALRAGKSAVRQ
jgi:hypothetical protein